LKLKGKQTQICVERLFQTKF